MALFSKKSGQADAASTPSAPADGTEKKRGLKLGRKKDAAPDAASPAAPAAPAADPAAGASVEDFSDFAPEALSGAATDADEAGGKGKKRKKGAPTDRAAKPKVAKSGTLVGLNIGNDSIKVVEATAKGGEITVTALGMMPTPPDSISNGVVMNVSALSHAIRDLFKQSGVKSKAVVTSVAGTGSLVVRVIEVPKMSDKELVENMSVDA
ncbi:MAG: pilus assembly protein PilM, partial [Armatimonadota bacterium]|nr:pilus assembly protein PilM [Armatimonadota bacterium]